MLPVDRLGSSPDDLVKFDGARLRQGRDALGCCAARPPRPLPFSPCRIVPAACSKRTMLQQRGSSSVRLGEDALAPGWGARRAVCEEGTGRLTRSLIVIGLSDQVYAVLLAWTSDGDELESAQASRWCLASRHSVRSRPTCWLVFTRTRMTKCCLDAHLPSLPQYDRMMPTLMRTSPGSLTQWSSPDVTLWSRSRLSPTPPV